MRGRSHSDRGHLRFLGGSHEKNGASLTLKVSAKERAYLQWDILNSLPPGTTGSQVAKATLHLVGRRDESRQHQYRSGGRRLG